MTLLLVAIGAAIGAPLRYLTDHAIRTRQKSRFPWGTLIVNVTGSLLLGFLVGLPVSDRWAALLATGFCGALTTYSTFGWETMALARKDAARLALLNVAVSILAGLAAAALGYLAAQSLAG